MAKIEIFKYVTDVAEIPAGTTIFHEGDSGNMMYVLQDGEAEVQVNGAVIETIGPGSIVGEMALIDTSPRSATVVAKTDCKAVALNEQEFLNHVHRTPFFAIQVMRVMANRLRNMNSIEM